MEPLELVAAETVPLGDKTYLWLDIRSFAIDALRDDRVLLEALLAEPAYHDDYLAKFDPDSFDPDQIDPAEWEVHARWKIAAIDVSRFGPVTPEHATEVIWRWMTDQKWPEGYPALASRTHLRDRFVSYLGNGAVYELANPSDDDQHDWGWALGPCGYHEFVVIDRTTRRLHVLVASDD